MEQSIQVELAQLEQTQMAVGEAAQELPLMVLTHQQLLVVMVDLAAAALVEVYLAALVAQESSIFITKEKNDNNDL